MVMEQCPTGECCWGYQRLADATGLTVDLLKAPLARLVRKGMICRVAKGVFRVQSPPAGEGSLRVLNEQTGAQWSDPGNETEILYVPAGGWLELPLASPAMQVMKALVPWLLDPSNAEAMKFWEGLTRKAKRLAARLKRDVPGAMVTYLLLRPVAEWLRESGGLPSGLRQPVGALLWRAGSATPRTIDDAAWEKAEKALTLGGDTIGQLFSVTKGGAVRE
jgi:hypothetical protein